MEDQTPFTGIEGSKVAFNREMPVPFKPQVPEHGGNEHESRPSATFVERPRRLAISENPNLIIIQGTAANKFKITPGTVNSEMPTLATVALDNATAPEATIAVTTYFWLKCVGTFGSPDTYVVTVETETVAATPPAADAISGTGFTSCFYIGGVVWAAGAGAITNDHGGGNLGVESFGAINLWWKK